MTAQPHPDPVVEFAPAKINLYLHVLGRRPDGFHDLDSLVAFAAVGDRVTAQPADRLSLRLDGPFAAALASEPVADNLVVRAAEALAAALDRAPTVALRLTKILPVASGIGGGSADAAACLRALCALWRIPVTDPVVYRTAAILGADVPVCVASRPAYFRERGDLIDPAPPLPAAPVVLVNPGVAVPTPAVFRRRTGPFSGPARLPTPPAGIDALAEELVRRRNDLTEPAIAVAPAIARVLDALAALEGALVTRMSGSGATCFALFRSADDAAAAARRLAAAAPTWWVVATELVA